MKYTSDQITEMKRWCYEDDGTVIDDDEAERAWDTVLDVFKTLLEWDKENQQKI